MVNQVRHLSCMLLQRIVCTLTVEEQVLYSPLGQQIRMDNLKRTQDTAFLSPKTQLLLDYTPWPYEIINGPLQGLNV